MTVKSLPLLREFVRRTLLSELEIDHNFLDILTHRSHQSRVGARLLAHTWIAAAKLEGAEFTADERAEVQSFVNHRLPRVKKVFPDDDDAAAAEMNRLLDLRFSTILLRQEK